jgi:3-phosphoglycerate kinase
MSTMPLALPTVRMLPTQVSAQFFPQAAMGLLMERELKYLVDELAKPERPFLVVLGGSKGFIENHRD